MVTLKNDKQKDDEEFGDIRLETKRVFVGKDEDGEPTTSLVLTSEIGPHLTGDTVARPSAAAQRALKALWEFPFGKLSSVNGAMP